MKDWILVANKSKANVYELGRKKLKLIKTIENEKARLKEKDLVSDSPGIVINSITGSGGRDLGEKKALKQAQRVYAHKISSFFKKSQTTNQYNHLFVFADPSFLGDISNEFSRLKLDIEKKVNKDISKFKEHELKELIEQNIF